MQYANIRPAVFRSRPNRFIAKVEIDGQEETVRSGEVSVRGLYGYVE